LWGVRGLWLRRRVWMLEEENLSWRVGFLY
jgi:hypothetical protein